MGILGVNLLSREGNSQTGHRMFQLAFTCLRFPFTNQIVKIILCDRIIISHPEIKSYVFISLFIQNTKESWNPCILLIISFRDMLFFFSFLWIIVSSRMDIYSRFFYILLLVFYG